MAFFSSVFNRKTPAIVHDKKFLNTLATTIRAGVIGLTMLTINPTLLYAQDKKMDLSQQISSLQVQLATVVLVPEMWSFYAPLNEASLLESGCIYNARDPLIIAGLKDILIRSELKVVTDFVVKPEISWGYPFDLRNGIFLTLTDGTVVKFLFGYGDNSQNAVQGILKNPLAFKSTSFSALNSLPQDMRKWAPKFAVLDAQNPDMVANCLAAIHL
ncbi:hypothetical protein [Undibacterium sp.]|uniref:hypothetical protein n=1 Tax=Undibacterium sp. TaxID=1914977 RepID=UPI0025E1B4F9|nr:hypothetical protein [Undibacterium sp.]